MDLCVLGTITEMRLWWLWRDPRGDGMRYASCSRVLRRYSRRGPHTSRELIKVDFPVNNLLTSFCFPLPLSRLPMHLKTFTTDQLRVAARALQEHWQIQRSRIRAHSARQVSMLRAGQTEGFVEFVEDLVCFFATKPFSLLIPLM
jgi:hypothetical protein